MGIAGDNGARRRAVRLCAVGEMMFLWRCLTCGVTDRSIATHKKANMFVDFAGFVFWFPYENVSRKWIGRGFPARSEKITNRSPHRSVRFFQELAPEQDVRYKKRAGMSAIVHDIVFYAINRSVEVSVGLTVDTSANEGKMRREKARFDDGCGHKMGVSEGWRDAL